MGATWAWGPTPQVHVLPAVSRSMFFKALSRAGPAACCVRCATARWLGHACGITCGVCGLGGRARLAAGTVAHWVDLVRVSNLVRRVASSLPGPPLLVRLPWVAAFGNRLLHGAPWLPTMLGCSLFPSGTHPLGDTRRNGQNRRAIVDLDGVDGLPASLDPHCAGHRCRGGRMPPGKGAWSHR